MKWLKPRWWPREPRPILDLPPVLPETEAEQLARIRATFLGILRGGGASFTTGDLLLLIAMVERRVKELSP